MRHYRNISVKQSLGKGVNIKVFCFLSAGLLKFKIYGSYWAAVNIKGNVNCHFVRITSNGFFVFQGYYSTEILRYANDLCKRFLSDVNSIGLSCTHFGTRAISGLFTLADTEIQTETYKKTCIWLCGVVCTALRDRCKFPLGSVHILLVSVSVLISVSGAVNEPLVLTSQITFGVAKCEMCHTCSNRIGPTRCEARVVCDVCSFHSVAPYQCRHEVFYTQSPTVCQSSARTENRENKVTKNMYKEQNIF